MSGDIPRQATVDQEPQATVDEELAALPFPDQQISFLTRTLRHEVATDRTDWIFTLAALVSRHQLSRHVARRSAADLAWAAREAGQRYPNDADWSRCSEAADPVMARRVLAYVHGYRLRFDFRFDDLAARTREWMGLVPDDALIQSFAAFAALGQRSDRAEHLLRRATAAADYDLSCRAVCLHGLWLADHLPDQADRIIALSDEMISKGEDGANLYYWRSFALRRKGLLDEALASVNRAIALLPPGMNAVHQDYVRERELINTTRLLNEHVRRLADGLEAELRRQVQHHQEQVRSEIERHAREAQRIVSQSLLGIVEVLALFVTLAGFLIGSGVLVLRAEGFGQGLAAIALLATGAIGFFLLLRFVVRFERRRRHR